ncbi:unnamed protein product [Leptosia nina]|uniref:GRIP domain-containing protein n=1 Tax=Leptosia nina TaxID=320188 RepID=A0AAV1JIQ7_9NEOP
MFKKFKDKLAEEVKSSPQRIQQFAQAAQAAVTSASSSVSDITNNDLFSIGDNENSTKTNMPGPQANLTQNYSQGSQSTTDLPDFSIDYEDRQRHRRLSNSSFASDISFRLPNYESPSMYHLQSDMEVSASEAEEKGFFGGSVNLDRVTKDQLYAAYRRTQDRFKKYKSQYSDLARHYKLLERENAKARNVLVETQDKALRRISELKEQCSLEQSAKAHLEKALRVEIEEKNMKINALTTQLNLLQVNNVSETKNIEQSQMELINLNEENNTQPEHTSEVSVLNNKIEKLEQLLCKYKESLKSLKEKNSNLTTEIQKLNMDLETKSQKEKDLIEAEKKVDDLLGKVESLESMNSTLEFTKNKEISILQDNLQHTRSEMLNIQTKVKGLSKREEEYAISLAENKLRIHKELESKEAEIKSLKDNLSKRQHEIETLNEIIQENKNKIQKLEGECAKLNDDLLEFNRSKTKIEQLTKERDSINETRKQLENIKTKLEEDINCLHLQLKQETAEKLSVIDRNVYLESRNTQITEENDKKRSYINELEEELLLLKNKTEKMEIIENKPEINVTESISKLQEETAVWKLKCSALESEIQEERVELVKLQAEVDKLLQNHESLQKQNLELNATVEMLKCENVNLCNTVKKYNPIVAKLEKLKNEVISIHDIVAVTSSQTKSLRDLVMQQWLPELKENIFKHTTISQTEISSLNQIQISLKEHILKLTGKYDSLSNDHEELKRENNSLSASLKEKQSEYVSLSENINSIAVEKDTYISKYQSKCDKVEKENQDLQNNIKVLNESITELQKELKNSKEMYSCCMEKLEEETKATNTNKDETDRILKEMEDNLRLAEQDNSDMENRHKALEEEFKKLSDNHSKSESEYASLKLEKEHIMSDLENVRKEKLELLLSKTMTEETLKKIELELTEVRNNFDKKIKEMDIENHGLKSLQSELENKLKLAEEKLLDLSKLWEKTEKENAEMKEKNCELDKIISSQNIIIDDKENIILSNNKCECDSLKEDNRRLRSDIDGLQIYLSKISKENSELNNRLRESFASSVDATNSEQLLTEIKLGKDKINELLRENSLLVEENLELKDQIHSQIDSAKVMVTANKESARNNDVELKSLHENHQQLLNAKNNLESKVEELEQMNISLNKNIDQNQNSYERLKLSNEKLQRKLDEALVSLRHLHALEENTELEYLRNILYEYLTGSGSHSLTLAKVLAAVVKFDKRQTEQVILKEKERQSFLHQFGIL